MTEDKPIDSVQHFENDSIQNCPSCKKQQSIQNKFCEFCGQNFSSEKIKSKKKRNLQDIKLKEEKNKNQRRVNDGRILIFVITVTSFVLFLFMANANDMNSVNEDEEGMGISYYKLVSYITLGLGFVYLAMFFWSFKNIFIALVVSFSVFLIETGFVIFFSGVKFGPLFLIYKAVIIVFLILAIKASLNLKGSSKKQLEIK